MSFLLSPLHIFWNIKELRKRMLKTGYEFFAFTVTYFLEHSRTQETYVKNKL